MQGTSIKTLLSRSGLGKLMADLKSEFDKLKLTLPNASAGFVQDVWYALTFPRTLPALKDVPRTEHENRCIEVLQHCLSSFDNEKWPRGTVDHIAWETLMNILGGCLNLSNSKNRVLVDRITNWNEDEKQFARNFANAVFKGNLEEWKIIIARDQNNN